MQNRAKPTLVFGTSLGWWKGCLRNRDILKHDLAADSWASLEGNESSWAEAGDAKGARCLGHPNTCQEYKHGSGLSGPPSVSFPGG